MRRIVALFIIVGFTLVSCHRVYVGGGATYPAGSGYVSVGGAVDTDDSGAAIVAASLLGILVGAAIYNDVHSYREKGLSAYDVNIKPKDADIYLDGVYVGKADDFDGSPKFLVVKPGTHTITAKKPGYKTYTVRVSINPGEQINLNKHLEPAPVLSDKGNKGHSEIKGEGKRDYKYQTVFVKFKVKDKNARVYLDNTFVGTIREIENLHKPLMIETTVKNIIVESKGARIEFSLEDLVKRQGRHITITTEF